MHCGLIPLYVYVCMHESFGIVFDFRLLQDANLSSDVQNQALESLKSKLTQAETQLREEREQTESARWESAQRESQLQAEKMQLSEALASQQKQHGFQQMKMVECQAALRNAQSESQAVRKEYEDYKQRAAGILQVSEKISLLARGVCFNIRT